MTRLLTCGYETGDINEAGVNTIGTNATLSVVSSTPTPRSPGSYCLKLGMFGTAALGSYKTFALPVAKTEIWVRYAVYFHVLGTPGEITIGVTLDSAGAGQTNIGWDAASNVLYLRLGGIVGGTLLATSTATLSPDAWHLIEWRTQITSTTVGVSEVWLDGSRVINFSGDNTNTATANVQSVRIGCPSSGSSANNGAYFAFDDIAINDTSGTINNGQIFDGRVVLLKPNGAGSNAAQTRGGTDSGANWDQCNELPPSMTDYVYSVTAGTRDTYALEDIPAGSWSVNCVEAITYAQNSDALAGALGLTVKSGATTNEGTAQALTTGAQYYRQLYETDPNTSAAWTNAAVNALEAGTTVR
jgi:hypothetical protein